YLIPALGGAERRIASFGYHPRWSPDSSQVLFQTNFAGLGLSEKFWLVGLDGNAPREVFSGSQIMEDPRGQPDQLSAAWHPDGRRISVWAAGSLKFWTLPVAGGALSTLAMAPQILEELSKVSAGTLPEPSQDFKFCWAPSAEAVFFERTFQGAENVWRLRIDPRTSAGIAVERLTTG